MNADLHCGLTSFLISAYVELFVVELSILLNLLVAAQVPRVAPHLALEQRRGGHREEAGRGPGEEAESGAGEGQEAGRPPREDLPRQGEEREGTREVLRQGS